MQKDDLILVCGSRGMVGSALVRALEARGHTRLLVPTSRDLDLTRCDYVDAYFADHRPEHVFLAAAKVGGIVANDSHPAEFIQINLQIQGNVIHSAWRNGTRSLVFFSSSCAYPRLCPQPMREESLWTGVLEPTNAPYAAAKLAGMMMCQAYNRQYGTSFATVIPTNLYGPNDNFDPQSSHLIAGLISKLHHATTTGKPVVHLWGSGAPRRELMHVDDAVDAVLHLEERGALGDPINIGTGQDHTVRELAEVVARIVGFAGELRFDPSRPDGAPRKCLDVTRLRSTGWVPRFSLSSGIADAYWWYRDSLPPANEDRSRPLGA